MSPSIRRIRRSAAGVLLLAIAAVLGAYPIPPRTLWGLTDEAELVVVARVEAVGEVPADADPTAWTPARARLAVVETLKGEAGDTIEVAYHPGLICPAPPRFVAGRTVLAFLDWEPEVGAWIVPDLSYGTLYPRERELPLFKDMIALALSLQSEIRKSPKPPVDWLVEAAAHRATRWHGLYELAAAFDAVHSYYDRGTDRDDLRSELSPAQLSKIAHGFVAEPSTDVTFLQTLGVLAGHADAEFDRVALGLIEQGLSDEKAPYWLDEALEHALRRFGGGEVEPRILALGENSWDRPLDGLRELWARTKIEHGVPEVEPIELHEPESDEEEVRGVGGTTPP